MDVPRGSTAGAAEYDVLVIGGGCNGSGVARDCAMRGLKTCLVEKRDLGAGTTGNSSGMIHGGLKYLLSDVSVTKRSCLDSGYIQKIAPHLLFRIPFLIPLLRQQPLPAVQLALFDTLGDCYDVYQPLKNGHPHVRLTREEVLAIEPGMTQDVSGAVTIDEWGIDTYRLCASNALSAASHGARVLTHTAVCELLKDGSGRVAGARLEDATSKKRVDVFARIVVNAGGPWMPRIAALAGCVVQIRPGKGVHLVTDRRISNTGIIVRAIDGRQIFVMPHENHSWLGNTDDDYFGDPDDVEANRDDVEYLKEGVARYFPAIRGARIVNTMSGIRPTLYGRGRYENDLSREHEILDHEAQDGVAGFYSMLGGKLASFRIFAEEMTDLVCARLGAIAKCRTHVEPLPGGESTPDEVAWAEKLSISPYAARRLAYRQGSVGTTILETIAAEDECRRAVVCPCEPVTDAEVRHAIRHEWARCLDDVRRRTRLGMGPCQGALCATRGAAVLADEKNLGSDDALREVWRFHARLWKERRPALDGPQLAQEELSRGLNLGVFRLHSLAPLPEDP